MCRGAGDGGDKVVIVSEEPVCFGVPGNSQTPKGTEEPVEWCSYQVPSKGSLWSLHVCALLAFVVGHSHHETPESGIRTAGSSRDKIKKRGHPTSLHAHLRDTRR